MTNSYRPSIFILQVSEVIHYLFFVDKSQAWNTLRESPRSIHILENGFNKYNSKFKEAGAYPNYKTSVKDYGRLKKLWIKS